MTCSILTVLLLALGCADSVPALVRLPEPARASACSVEEALQRRRSCRSFSKQPVHLEHLSQILWAAQGITRADGRRTAPSAGALYPLEIYVVAGEVPGLPSGSYRYLPREHALLPTASTDLRADIAAAAVHQDWMVQAPVILAVAADYGRTTGKYKERGVRYVHIEVGLAAQNVCLQVEALGLGATIVGAFQDQEMKTLLGLPEEEEPLTLIPVGHPLTEEDREIEQD